AQVGPNIRIDHQALLSAAYAVTSGVRAALNDLDTAITTLRPSTLISAAAAIAASNARSSDDSETVGSPLATVSACAVYAAVCRGSSTAFGFFVRLIPIMPGFMNPP